MLDDDDDDNAQPLPLSEEVEDQDCYGEETVGLDCSEDLEREGGNQEDAVEG